MSAEISIFDDIRHDDTSREFWSARELQKILGYASWGKFQNVSIEPRNLLKQVK